MDKELIVYVDEQGIPNGQTAEKLAGHTANTKLHLAFSCYIFNDNGELLVTQRAFEKKVWPGVWTNSVCGHPGPGESQEDAIRRRLAFELGMKTGKLELLLPNYIYKTPPFKGVVEHEFCPVFITRSSDTPHPNPNEVAAYKWLSWADYQKQLQQDEHNVWSWWCKDQLPKIQQLPAFKAFLASFA